MSEDTKHTSGSLHFHDPNWIGESRVISVHVQDAERHHAVFACLIHDGIPEQEAIANAQRLLSVWPHASAQAARIAELGGALVDAAKEFSSLEDVYDKRGRFIDTLTAQVERLRGEIEDIVSRDEHDASHLGAILAETGKPGLIEATDFAIDRIAGKEGE